MSKYLLTAMGLFAGAAALAQAPQPPQARADVQKQIDQNFDQGDTNNDNFLSRAEVQAMTNKAVQGLEPKIEAEFKALDKDGNGQITLAEFKAAAAAKLAQSQNPDQALQRFDTNKDGKISTTEFAAPFMAAFDRADLNKDGTVSPEEQRKAMGRP